MAQQKKYDETARQALKNQFGIEYGGQESQSVYDKMLLANEEKKLQQQLVEQKYKSEQENKSQYDTVIESGKYADALQKLYDAGMASPQQMTQGQPEQVQPQAPREKILQPTSARAGTLSPLAATPQADPQPQYKTIPKGFDRFGRPTGYEIDKPSESANKRNIEISELEGQMKNLFALFGTAQKEAKSKVPYSGSKGIPGRIAGKIVGGMGAAGYSPNVNVYNDKRKAFATVVAKAAGEVRPTDEDIKRFMGTLFDIGKSDEENKILADQLIADLKARGAQAVWAGRTGKSSPQSQQQPAQSNQPTSDPLGLR
jgi:hypothetical protein